MSNAIYATTPSQDWVSVAKKLSLEDDLNPSYWVCPPSFQSEIELAFPGATVYSSSDAIQGRFDDKYCNNISQSTLNSNVLNKFSNCESIVMKMMDRMDVGNATGAHFTYSERIRHYHRQLAYWINVVDRVNPEVVVFGAAPHLIYDYVLYSVCQKRDIETLLCTHTGLPERFYIRKGIFEGPDGISSITSKDEHIPSDIEQHIVKLRREYERAKPSYMKSDTNSIRPIGRLISGRKAILREIVNNPYIWEKKPKSYFKTNNNSIEESEPSTLQFIQYDLQSAYYKYKLERQYQRQTIDPNYDNRYIYMALHYQPERTTSPEAGQYVHQYLAINQLAAALPDNHVMYVKEHPSQFASRLKGDQGRQPQFYADLRDINGVKLVPADANSFSLIDNATAVATATGTVGWEALVRGTPVIVFGNAWYRDAKGCYAVSDTTNFETAVGDALNHGPVSENEVSEFLTRLEAVSYQGSLNSVDQNNEEAFYLAIKDHCRAISS